MNVKWCITRALYPVEKNPQRIKKIPKEQSDPLDCRGINFLVELDKIKKFEKQNENITVNVFGCESEARVYPLRISKSPAEERNQVINLLLIEKDGDAVANKHYCFINNMSRLLSSQVKSVAVGSYTNKEVDIKTELPFIDSLKFMASLDKLKGSVSYEYMSSIEKFGETELPPKREFYSKLTDCDITDEDYEHAKKIWNELKMKNMGDYHDLYLKSDVHLLADVFEEFRNVCLENYNLNPAWCYTAPGLAGDAALKVTKVELELLSDLEMLLMFKKGIRGGISMIPNHHGKANNKYMGKQFDREKTIKISGYLDANNLYG
ncbi:hypothetical protein AWC38_SpisGene20691 [Stylophora pistillata]|uniref:DNA-directed DNA polymerase n=1 Tax=Stylophora pistillata TaxID=50429 RepID=A0A2B4RD70_STYPI|nr:hypothetical protein AWC38_SpisGene20691 [Stylophora pistillata]